MKKYGTFIVILIIAGLIFLFSYAIYDTLAPAYKASAEDSSREETSENEKQEETSESRQIAAEDFEVLDQDGNQVALSDFSGQPVIINFWATWCGPCRSELQSFDDLYKEYGSEIRFMMVNLTDGTQDTVKGVKSFVEENGYSFPVFFDTEASATRAYGVYSVPMTIVMNADRNMVSTHVGAIDAETIENYILKAIQ